MWGEGKRRWGGKWARWHVLSNLPTTAQSYASYSSGLIIQVPSSLQFSVFSQSLQQALAASLLRKPGHRPRSYHITWVTRAQGLGICLPARSSPTSSGTLPFVREKFWIGTGKWHLILEMGFLGGSDHHLLLSFSCWDRRRRWHPTPVLLPGKSHGRRSLVHSMRSWRVGHNWATSLSLFTFMHWRRKWQPTPVVLPGESQGWRLSGGLPSMG